MATQADRIARLNQAQLAAMGEPIEYRPVGGGSIATACLLRKPAVMQATAPGEFAEIEVDPLAIGTPLKGDVVVWADGTLYLVKIVVGPPYGLTTLKMQKKDAA